MILEALYFFVPAYVANMSPVFLKKIPFLGKPIDGGRTWNNQPLFGKNKTWRGLIGGTILAQIAFLLQQYGYSQGFSLALLPYSELPFFLGALLGFGALLGDVLESAVKRQQGIKPGQMFFFWDQIDFMIGAVLFSLPHWLPKWRWVLLSTLIIFVSTIAVQKMGYWLKFKEDPL